MNEHPGVQVIRVLDVIVVGPLMLVAARQVRSPWLQLGLTLTGWATMIYNGGRWLAIEQERTGSVPGGTR